MPRFLPTAGLGNAAAAKFFPPCPRRLSRGRKNGFYPSPRRAPPSPAWRCRAEVGRKIALLIVVATMIALLYPALQQTYSGARHQPHSNLDSQAAQALEGLGIKPGDRVARISPNVSDYAAERILRVQIAAEVDHDHADEFWSSPFATQQSLLNQFASRGVKAVIATSPSDR